MANPFQGDDIDPFSGARDEESSTVVEQKEEPVQKKQTFGQAFRDARKSGDKTFMFNGKKYSTELASEKAPAKVSAQNKTESSDRSVAKAEGSFADRQAYKRATKAAQADEKRKAMGMKKGGMVSSASKRADGCATKGKTKGRMV